MQAVVSLLLANYDAAYDRSSWHGTNLKGSIRALSLERVLWRPAPGRHNVWELTLHAAYWKFVARRRLLKIRAGSFPVQGRDWMTSPSDADEGGWREIVALLESEHRALREAIASVTPAQLAQPRTLRMLYGIAAHDLYHAGQIQLVKRLHRG
jgi:hypothetical protein